MKRPKTTKPISDDEERMRAAARRLEELLKDAGPNIIVTPIIDQSKPEKSADAAPATAADLDHVPGIEPLTITTTSKSFLTEAGPAAVSSTNGARSKSDTDNPGAANSLSNVASATLDVPAASEAAASTTEIEPSGKATTETASAAIPDATALPREKASRSEAAKPALKRAKLAAEKIAQALGRETSQPPIPHTAPPVKAALTTGRGELRDAINASRQQFIATGAFSFVINILMLTGPIFMLQVYDRVMTSHSMSTLVALTIMTSALYAITGMLELVRTRVIVRVGTEIDRRVGDRIFRASLQRSIVSQTASTSALRELDNLRQFLSSQGPLTFFDAPWTPVYLLVIFMVHWVLGVAATAGAAVLLTLAWASEQQSRRPMTEAGKAAAKSLEIAETGQRNAEALTAMGMLGAYRARWQTANSEALAWQIRTADRLGSYSAATKTLRLLMQSLMLAIGAALAINNEISAGAIIAATIIFGRALAPVEQAIGHWRSFLKARESFNRLDELLARTPEPAKRTALPAPKGRLEVIGLRVAAPDTKQLILANVAFAVNPGQMLAVIGPSASGKSTLARTLVGLWQPFAGAVKLDDARLDQWDPEALGRHIGYLPQNVDLFAGTVKENISRFVSDATDDEIVAAAKQAHAHELILALPQGYETQLGAFGTYLSSGQRQRIGLSRALFRNPALVVLDEPNSNLDRAGDEALSHAIDGMRARGQAIVLVSHRVQAIGKADLLLYLDRGMQRAFGPRQEVMKMFQKGFETPEPSGEAPGAQAPRKADAKPKTLLEPPTTVKQ